MQTPLDFWRGCQPLGSRSMTIPTPAHYVSVVSPEWTVPYTATVADRAACTTKQCTTT